MQKKPKGKAEENEGKKKEPVIAARLPAGAAMLHIAAGPAVAVLYSTREDPWGLSRGVVPVLVFVVSTLYATLYFWRSLAAQVGTGRSGPSSSSPSLPRNVAATLQRAWHSPTVIPPPVLFFELLAVAGSWAPAPALLLCVFEGTAGWLPNLQPWVVAAVTGRVLLLGRAANDAAVDHVLKQFGSDRAATAGKPTWSFAPRLECAAAVAFPVLSTVSIACAAGTSGALPPPAAAITVVAAAGASWLTAGAACAISVASERETRASAERARDARVHDLGAECARLRKALGAAEEASAGLEGTVRAREDKVASLRAKLEGALREKEQLRAKLSAGGSKKAAAAKADRDRSSGPAAPVKRDPAAEGRNGGEGRKRRESTGAKPGPGRAEDAIAAAGTGAADRGSPARSAPAPAPRASPNAHDLSNSALREEVHRLSMKVVDLEAEKSALAAQAARARHADQRRATLAPSAANGAVGPAEDDRRPPPSSSSSATLAPDADGERSCGDPADRDHIHAALDEALETIRTAGDLEDRLEHLTSIIRDLEARVAPGDGDVHGGEDAAAMAPGEKILHRAIDHVAAAHTREMTGAPASTRCAALASTLRSVIRWDSGSITVGLDGRRHVVRELGGDLIVRVSRDDVPVREFVARIADSVGCDDVIGANGDEPDSACNGQESVQGVSSHRKPSLSQGSRKQKSKGRRRKE